MDPLLIAVMATTVISLVMIFRMKSEEPSQPVSAPRAPRGRVYDIPTEESYPQLAEPEDFYANEEDFALYGDEE